MGFNSGFKGLMKLEFSRQIFEKPQLINVIKICPARAELFHENGRWDRQTDRHDKANSRFSQFWVSA